MPPTIEQFEGEHFFLSNFAPSPMDFEGYRYASAEHAYQAAKTLNPAQQERIRQAPDADAAKELAKEIDLRPDWESVRVETMERVVRAKFLSSPALLDKLLATGNAVLEEGNWWGDTFWGIFEGQGENQLGQLLMKVREELRSQT